MRLLPDNRIRSSWLTRVLLTALILLGSWTLSGGVRAAHPGSFTFRLTGEPETLDWNRAHTTIETYLLMNLMEGLVSFDEKMNVVSALAQSWKRSEDGRTYTFKIRPGVKWSDGVSLRAQDFVFSWKRLLSPLTAASYAYLLFDIEGAEYFNRGKLKDFSEVGIKALDDLTLQVKLARPVAHWIYIPTFWVTFPLREDVVSKHGEGWARPGRLVTLGAFTLDSYEIDQRIVMKSNPRYYAKKGNIEQAIGLIVKDDATALSLYESGKFDFLTEISSYDLKRLSTSAELKRFPYFKTTYLGFNLRKPVVGAVGLRRAIAQAIDKSKLVSLLYGNQKPATSFVPPGILGYSEKAGLAFNPILARDELKRSGWSSGRNVRIELLTPSWDKSLTVAQFVQAELKKNLGLDVQVSPFDHKSYRAQLDVGAFPAFQGSWGADYPDPDNFLSVFLKAGGNNRWNWSSDAFDDSVLQARSILKATTREQFYVRAQKTLLEDTAILVPLYYDTNVALVKPRVKGLQLNPLNYLYLKSVQLQ